MSGKAKIAVVLSGCGVYDGAEIHEAVMTLLALDRHGAEAVCLAPDAPQHHVVNHLTGQETGESRNILVEAARIARGKIKPLGGFDAADYDGIIFPGGFGAAKNLCSLAFDGPGCSVNQDVEAAVKAMAAANKPIGALCISPALIARILGNVTVTIGNDADTAQAITAMGGTHQQAGHGEVVIDRARKVATTPCYMLDATIAQIADGADAVVRAVLEMAKA